MKIRYSKYLTDIHQKLCSVQKVLSCVKVYLNERQCKCRAFANCGFSFKFVLIVLARNILAEFKDVSI